MKKYMKVYEKNSERTNALMEKFVIAPYKNHELTDSWNYFADKGCDYHRKSILVRGRANFNKNYIDPNTDLELSVIDMEILYRYYYFQFHYTSSLYINNLANKVIGTVITNQNIAFIDFGCGPFTSGIAFKEYCTEKGISLTMNYHGFDIAQVMLDSGKSIAEYSNQIYFNSDNKFYKNYNVLDTISVIDSEVVIINFCYFLAAKTLNINDFIKYFKPFLEVNRNKLIFVIYQNPKGYSDKWNKIKQVLENFITLKEYREILVVSFDAVEGTWGFSNPVSREVDFDYLSNKV